LEPLPAPLHDLLMADNFLSGDGGFGVIEFRFH
jgi:hypothetical protein